MITKQPIVEKCFGCNKIVSDTDYSKQVMDKDTCSVYIIPASKWRIGNCPAATHVEKEKVEDRFVDPLKASKQKMKKKK